MQNQQVRRKDPQVEKHAHGGCEEHQVDNVRGGSNDGRQNENAQDGIAAVGKEEPRADDAQQREKENQNRQFKHQANAHCYVKEQVEVSAHGDHGFHSFALSDAQQKGQTIAEDDKVGKDSAQDEQAGRDQDEGSGPAAFPAVKARRDECPNLIQDAGGAEKNGAGNGDLE